MISNLDELGTKWMMIGQEKVQRDSSCVYGYVFMI